MESIEEREGEKKEGEYVFKREYRLLQKWREPWYTTQY